MTRFPVYTQYLCTAKFFPLQAMAQAKPGQSQAKASGFQAKPSQNITKCIAKHLRENNSAAGLCDIEPELIHKVAVGLSLRALKLPKENQKPRWRTSSMGLRDRALLLGYNSTTAE